MRPSGSSIAETSDVPVLSRAGTPMSLGPRTRPISANVYGASEVGAADELSPIGAATASTTPADTDAQRVPTIDQAYTSALRLSSGHPTDRRPYDRYWRG